MICFFCRCRSGQQKPFLDARLTGMNSAILFYRQSVKVGLGLAFKEWYMFKVLIVFGFCLFMTSCGDGSNYNRGYVISQSQIEAEPEIEAAD